MIKDTSLPNDLPYQPMNLQMDSNVLSVYLFETMSKLIVYITIATIVNALSVIIGSVLIVNGLLSLYFKLNVGEFVMDTLSYIKLCTFSSGLLNLAQAYSGYSFLNSYRTYWLFTHMVLEFIYMGLFVGLFIYTVLYPTIFLQLEHMIHSFILIIICTIGTYLEMLRRMCNILKRNSLLTKGW